MIQAPELLLGNIEQTVNSYKLNACNKALIKSSEQNISN
jgi:hypothetical protein